MSEERKITGKEYLLGYCELRLCGYSHEQSKEILSEIDEKMAEKEAQHG